MNGHSPFHTLETALNKDNAQTHSEKVFENHVRQIAPLTELICFHLMGDPLVHPMLSELIRICEKYPAKIFFVTNGVLLKEIHQSLLLSPAMYQVNFSLHSFFDNHPGKDPSIYLNKIFHWTKTAQSLRPDLYINYRLWNLQDTRGGFTENHDMLQRIETAFEFKVPSLVDVRKQKSVRI